MGTFRIVLAVVVVLVLVVAASARRERRASRRREKLRAALDRLWFDHADYTAQYIGAALGCGDPGPLVQRLHANQDQIAAAFGKYYGAPAQRELARLLHEHIAIAGRIVQARKEGRQAADLFREWGSNAEEIAGALSGANPRWARPEMAAMMRAHLSATSDYLAALLEKRWADAPALHDAVVDQISQMSAAMAAGIAADKLGANRLPL